MTVSAPLLGVSEEEWLGASAELGETTEVVGGELAAQKVGGNPHHYVAWRLAFAFEQQWPGVRATAPSVWALERSPDGRVLLGRIPDVLVDGDDLLTTAVFDGVPDAAVEVWSPGNTRAEMNDKRRQYRVAGLPVLLEVFLTETLDVHLEWLANAGERWETVAVALGERLLEIDTPRPFRVVPNDLLRRPS